MNTGIGTESVEPQGKKEREHSLFFEASRKVLLASIGAVVLAQEELEDFVEKLIERGEIAEKDGKKLVSEMKEKRKKHAHEIDEEISQKVRGALERMNIPTRADFEKLTSSIAVLSQKIDEMTKSRK